MGVNAFNYVAFPGLKATGDLSAKQYYTVKMASTAMAVKVCSATTDVAIGVLQNEPKDGTAADVAVLGVCKALMAASVTAGSYLIPNSTGYLKGTAQATVVKNVIGICIEASTSTAGEIHPVLLGR